MAQTDPIAPAALNSISQQIAEAIQLTADIRFLADESVPPKLERTLALWGIRPDALSALMKGADPERLGDWAYPLERWHHQLKFDTENHAFARSKVSPESLAEVEFRQLSMSAIAQEIERAIEWVEQNLQKEPAKYGLPSPYDPVIRLLEIPSSRVTALLLFDEAHDDTRILIIKALLGGDSLRPGTLLGSVEFLKLLAAQPSPRGIS